MLIRLENRDQIHIVRDTLRLTIGDSRFRAEIETPKSGHLKLRSIRLRETKPYCGNHPDFCDILPGRSGKPRKAAFLEGADWVAFDDMINNMCDRLNVEAHIASSACVIRRGKKRRVAYLSSHHHSGVWDKDGEGWFQDYCGRIDAPPSDYPSGTPGDYQIEP